MDPITYSPIKEGYRIQNENEAQVKETQFRNQYNVACTNYRNEAAMKIRNLKLKTPPDGFVCGVLVIIGAILLFPIGILIGAGIYFFLLGRTKQYNNNLDNVRIRTEQDRDNKIRQAQQNMEAQIKNAYLDADNKTKQQIARYDAEVNRNCQTILSKAEAFKPMVDHTVDMFQRMISHADAASNRKFVEAKLTYKVELFGICYKYQSTYTNPQDDFNFDMQRFRNLTTLEECEGFAQAIARMTMAKMKTLYPPNSLNMTVSHIDAEVTINFKAANKNYVPPRNIF